MADDVEALTAQNEQIAARIAALDTDSIAATAERNEVWKKLHEAGVSLDEIARPYDLKAQTVRWNLNNAAGATPRTSRTRGLKNGRKTAATKKPKAKAR